MLPFKKNLNNKSKEKFKLKTISLISLIIFISIGCYIYQYPLIQKQKELENKQSDIYPLEHNQETWEHYEHLLHPHLSLQKNFDLLGESDKNFFHRNFFKKIQQCLYLNLTVELETQLMLNLNQGSTRDAVMRGLLSKQEVNDYIEQNNTNLLSEELILYIGKFNRKYLQRDDFELPIDMREYELKVALMLESLDVADRYLVHDERKFYLWAAYILRETSGVFSSFKSNQLLMSAASKVPLDHLKSEVALAICQAIDQLSLMKKDKVIQNR